MHLKQDEKLRVCLVWPYGFEIDRVLPIALAFLKANLDETLYDVHILDNTYDERRFDDPEFLAALQAINPHVVGISGWTDSTSIEAMDIATLVKRHFPQTTTVMGGIHVTAYPEKAARNENVDFVIRGEGEFSFAAFLEQLKSEEPQWDKVSGLVFQSHEDPLVSYPMVYPDDLDAIKWPDYEAINLKGYLKKGYRYKTPSNLSAPIWVTRGCPYRCTFCSAPILNGKPVRTQSVEYMVKHIEYMYHEHGIRWFSIIDDNFTLNIRYAKAFCKAMIGLNLKDLRFGTPNGIRMQKGDSELWRLMKQAGWEFLVIAPESGSKRTLKLMKKDLDLDIVPRVVEEIHAAGLKVHAFFMIGYPGERPEDLMETGKMIANTEIDFPVIAQFQPLPGTPVYDDLVAAGEIPEGFTPGNATKGERSYISAELKGFNTSWFSFKTYCLLMLRKPLLIPYVISLYSPSLLFQRFGLQFLSAIGLHKYKPSQENRRVL